MSTESNKQTFIPIATRKTIKNLISETSIIAEFQKKRGSLIRAPPFRTTRSFKPPLGYLKDVGVGLMDSGCSNSAEVLPAVADPRID
jgi:hypothetical protein